MGDIVNFAAWRAELRRRAMCGELRLVPKVEGSFRTLLFDPISNAAPPDDAANDAGGDEGS